MPLGEDYEDARNLRKPFVNNNNNNAGTGSFFIVICVLVVALGPIQFGFTVLNSAIRSYTIDFIYFNLAVYKRIHFVSTDSHFFNI